MRIILSIILFVAGCVAISKTIAALVPISLFYVLANFLHIYGDEAVLNVMLATNIVISILLSLLLCAWLRRRYYC